MASRSRLTRKGTPNMKRVVIGCLSLMLVPMLPAAASDRVPIKPKRVSFPTQDAGLIVADLYGQGGRGVVLAHGARFDKESWEKQAQVLAQAGFRVLALDFRGYGQSKGPGQEQPFTAPLHLDVLAAVRYL